MHVIRMLQLLFFSGLAFFVLLKLLKRTETITLDTDWFYRKGSKLLVYVFTGISSGIASFFDYIFIRLLPAKLSAFSRRPIIGLMDMYMSATGRENPGAKCLIGERKPELVNLVPAGVPVLIAVAFLSLLAFLFMK